MTALVPVDQIERMALAVAKSGLFGVKTPDQAMALMLVAQAEGMHPAIAARDYHVINGRPTLKADAMLARFQAAGGRVEWSDYTDQCVVGTFSHPKGGSVTIEWTVEMGRKAGLLGNQTWSKYPRQMLRSRCISEGIRTVFPGVVVGSYSEEEGEDMAPQTIVRDMGNVEEVAAPAPAVPATPAVDVEKLIAMIKGATTREFLELLRPQMRLVPKGKDRDSVVAAVQRRADEIAAEQATAPEAEGGEV